MIETQPGMEGVTAALSNGDLWEDFHKEGNEMIITKLGRRMFPSLKMRVRGLDPEARYFVMLETILCSGSRYKFTSATWAAVGAAEPQSPPSARTYLHPDSPATGAAWMAQDIFFHRAKLTNNPLDRSGNLVLTSMHKYQPRIHIVKASDVLAVHWSPTATFTFPETQFIAVTAYQNEKITKLKIDNNPFAKGFRESGQARTKRKMQMKEEHEGEKEFKKCCISQHDDSGISDGSASPPLDVVSPPTPEPAPRLSEVPLPTYYPHNLWPYTPFLLPHYANPYLPYPAPYPYPTYPYTTANEPYLIDLSLRKHC